MVQQPAERRRARRCSIMGPAAATPGAHWAERTGQRVSSPWRSAAPGRARCHPRKFTAPPFQNIPVLLLARSSPRSPTTSTGASFRPVVLGWGGREAEVSSINKGPTYFQLLWLSCRFKAVKESCRTIYLSMEALESWLKALKLKLEAFLGANQPWPRESRALSVSQKVSRSWARGRACRQRSIGLKERP